MDLHVGDVEGEQTGARRVHVEVTQDEAARAPRVDDRGRVGFVAPEEHDGVGPGPDDDQARTGAQGHLRVGARCEQKDGVLAPDALQRLGRMGERGAGGAIAAGGDGGVHVESRPGRGDVRGRRRVAEARVDRCAFADAGGLGARAQCERDPLERRAGGATGRPFAARTAVRRTPGRGCAAGVSARATGSVRAGARGLAPRATRGATARYGRSARRSAATGRAGIAAEVRRREAGRCRVVAGQKTHGQPPPSCAAHVSLPDARVR
jgi:hypothetical protein